jgi:hypothetical protein
MSMHQYMPDQAVLADSWTLFCPECAQKMRIIMATPDHDGRETRTYECVALVLGTRWLRFLRLVTGFAMPRRQRSCVTSRN